MEQLNIDTDLLDPIENIEDFYILGNPIITDIGICYFLKVKDYMKILQYIDLLSLEKFQLIRHYKQIFDIGKMTKQFQDSQLQFIEHITKVIEQVELIQYIKNEQTAENILKRYKELFQICFKSDVFELIKTDEEFDYYRDLIITMNNIPVVKENPNPEIEEYNRLERELAAMESGNITFKSIYTSVWAFVGEEPYNMTLYKMYALFNRISCFKNSDATTLFRTVSNEVKTQHWYEDTKPTTRDKTMTMEELEKQSKQL